MTLRINLISSPRNISTALKYSFAQREDTQVVDEPFYGNYLSKSNSKHPGKEEIINSMEIDPHKIIANILNTHDKPVLFIKNMAHHLVDIDLSFLFKLTNVFLIRDPQRLITSFAKVIPNPTEKDIGVKKQFELFEMLQNQNPIVLDSGELLKDPQQVLNELCKKLNITFYKTMLSWPAGPIKEDGIWAKYWYKNVHSSTGFKKPSKKKIILPQHCRELYESTLKYYNHLYKYAIKV